MVLLVLCFLMSFGCVASEAPKINHIYVSTMKYLIISPELFDPSIEEDMSPISFAKSVYDKGFDICWFSDTQIICVDSGYKVQFCESAYSHPFTNNPIFKRESWFFVDILTAVMTKEFEFASWSKDLQKTLRFFKAISAGIVDLYKDFFMFLWGDAGEEVALYAFKEQIKALKLQSSTESKLILAAMGDVSSLSDVIHSSRPGDDDFCYSSESISSESESSDSDSD
jgi:hypothetical protein